MNTLNFIRTLIKLSLFDTYEGIPEDRVPDDEPAAFWNEYPNVYDFVCKKFSKFENVQIIKGIVPDSLSTVKINKVSCLSIDMNYSIPERAALDYFWDKMVSGGVITLDDYSFIGREKQKKLLMNLLLIKKLKY